MGLFLTLFLPTRVAAVPLGTIVGLLRLRPVAQSTGWMAGATVAAGVLGCASTGLAVLVCANGLATGRPAEGPQCGITGAAAFLFVGLAFTVAAVGYGAVHTLCHAVEQWRRT